MWWRKNKQSKPPAVYEGPRYRWMKRGFRFGLPVLLLVLWFWPAPYSHVAAWGSIYESGLISWISVYDTSVRNPPFRNFGISNKVPDWFGPFNVTRLYKVDVAQGIIEIGRYGVELDYESTAYLLAGSLALTLLTYLSLRSEKKRNFKRYNFSYCPSCGYNISRTETDTCPECGALIPWPPKDRYDRHRQIPHRTNRPSKTNA